MVKQTIQIFCRVKPTKLLTGIYDINHNDADQTIISFNVPRDLANGIVNNKKEIYDFCFDGIFNQEAKQDEIFCKVAQPVIDNVLSGFNGTIFAYGQTGSGKTFTITGGAERYADRGIIPRSLSHIFQHIIQNVGYVYTTHVSYLEIYNESGFDLLDPKHQASKLEDLPKVSLLEDTDGNIHLKHLSLHQANNEEEALNLLFLGDTNRMIAETPMNQASTRSHCIFTIHLSVTEPESATIRRSKLHLVDLAGSERVAKTGVGGNLLKEAKYINLSLHFLEQVIIALSEKSRNHIPYRNSMMTSVLRDSLGGNCMTSMIATCSVEKKNVDESISTCRFAQRVALIKNDAIMNEELDPKLMIVKLKREIQQLKDELALATGVQYENEMTEEDKQRLESLVRSYIEDRDVEARLAVGADMRKIHYCFQLMKKFCINNNRKLQSPISDNESATSRSMPAEASDNSYLANAELQKLKDLVLQRDNEINILVNMLKKEKQRADQASKKNEMNKSVSRSSSVRSISSDTIGPEKRPGEPSEELSPQKVQNHQKDGRNALLQNLSRKNKASMSVGRQEAFEIFKRDYHENHVIEENKRGLKNRYSDAKKLGELVNRSRQAINSLKSKIEKVKVRRSLKAASSGEITTSKIDDPEEQQLRQDLNQEKTKYKQSFNQLKMLKTEIEHMQHLLEKAKMKMQKDFELWWTEQTATLTEHQDLPHQVKSAWRTPPLLTPITHEQRLISEDSVRSSTSSISSASERSSNSRNGRTLLDSYKSSYRYDSAVNNSQKIKPSSSERPDSNDSSTPNTADKISYHQSSQSVSGKSRPTSNIRLTGDQKTDEDILAFMKAREELVRKSKFKF